mgnify:CR=1 FL=1
MYQERPTWRRGGAQAAPTSPCTPTARLPAQALPPSPVKHAQASAGAHLNAPGVSRGMSDRSTSRTTSRCCVLPRPFIISLLIRTKSSYVASAGTPTPARRRRERAHEVSGGRAGLYSGRLPAARVAPIRGAQRATRV